jgi:GNAT superfamily N-acetyltransferase
VNLHIRVFHPRDNAAARALIVAGLHERFPDYRDEFNADLLNIAAHHHVFLIGELEGQIVATGGLKLEDASTVAVARMSVARGARGQGFGKIMLNALLEIARDQGFTRAILLTGADWITATLLYESAGFKRVGMKSHAESGFHGLELELRLSSTNSSGAATTSST